MTLKSGSLKKAMAQHQNLAVVVIDEAGCSETRDAQKEVLTCAVQLGASIAFVDYDRTSGGYSAGTTDEELLKVVPKSKTFVKTEANALVESGLEAWLASFKPSYVVVMGMKTNCCVWETVMGAPTVTAKRGYFTDPGLVGRGYIVMCCPQIVHDGKASWDGHPKVEFYDQV